MKMTISSIKYFWGKKKFFLLFVFLFLVYIFSLFSGPVISDDKQIEFNTRNIHLPYGLGFSVGSDAGNYLRLANNPQLIFEKKRVVNGRELVPGNVGLSRPGMFFVVNIISKPMDLLFDNFNYLIDKVHSDVKRSLDYGYKVSGIEQKIEDSVPMIREYYSTYTAFLLFNIFLVFLSFSLYCKTIGLSSLNISSYSSLGLWIGVFLIINDITKKYLISPSPGIFNLFALCLTLYACVKMNKHSSNRIRLLIFSLIFGVSNLFYEIFIIPFITFYLAFLKIEMFDKRKKITGIVSDLKYLIIGIVFFVTPYLLWIIFVKIYNGNFFHFGLEAYPGFSVLKNDLTIVISNVTSKSLNAIWVACLSLIPVLFLLIIFSAIKIRTDGLGIFKSEFFVIPVIYSLLTLSFFSLYGEISSKHTLCIILGFLPFVNYLQVSIFNRKKNHFLLSIIIFFFFYSIYTARKTFPYGENILMNPFL